MQKIEKCRAFGANVILHGSNIGEGKLYAETDPRFAGLHYINGYDDPDIIAGAGTIGLEIIEQLPSVGTRATTSPWILSPPVTPVPPWQIT
jgi:threonine dehydratase